MNVLVANIGSTSLKYRLFAFDGEAATLVAKGGFERVTDYAAAIDQCLADLKRGGALADEGDLDAVGFKPVIAKDVSGCVEMDDTVLDAMQAWAGIAPAHNPPYINGVRGFRARIPAVPMVGLFETAFYQWLDPATTRFAVPRAWHDMGIRRWGFHGASHKFIAERSAELCGRRDVSERVRGLYVDGPQVLAGDRPALRVVSCHLGGSSSVTGILDGIAIGNSFGMTPQSGLPHNNRVGDLDPMAVPYLLRSGHSLESIEKALTSESGLKGISQVSNDVRDINAAAAAGNAQATLARDVLAREVRRWMGAFVLEMNGLDALVFTAGIGENDRELRRAICRDLDFLGLEIDESADDLAGREEALISTPASRVAVHVIRTNEELVIAREVRRWLQANTIRHASPQGEAPCNRQSV